MFNKGWILKSPAVAKPGWISAHHKSLAKSILLLTRSLELELHFDKVLHAYLACFVHNELVVVECISGGFWNTGTDSFAHWHHTSIRPVSVRQNREHAASEQRRNVSGLSMSERRENTHSENKSVRPVTVRENSVRAEYNSAMPASEYRTVPSGLSASDKLSSVQSLDRLGCWGDITDNSAEILFQSFLQEAPVSSSGMGRDVLSLMLSIQHFLCRPQHLLPSVVP